MELNFGGQNITIKIESYLSVYNDFWLEEEAEITQIITINGNGKLEFESYSFGKKLKRKEERNLNINIPKMINDVKNVLEKYGNIAAKDLGTWKIKIFDEDSSSEYFGVLGGKDENILLYGDISISDYLRSIIDIPNLILLDDKGNNQLSFNNDSKFKDINSANNNNSNEFYKKNESDLIWWVDNRDKVGEHLFSFDKEHIFNLFSDYPYKLTPEEKQIFDKENPYWADFFKDRNNKDD